MDWLEHGRKLLFGIEVRACRKPHAARNRRAKVRQDVPEEVGRHHNLEPFRILHHEHRCRINKIRMCLDIRIVRANLLEHLIPEDHRVVEGISLRDACQSLFLLPCKLVGVTHDAFATLPRENAMLDDGLLRRPPAAPLSGSRVLALGVLADENHVNVLALHTGKRTRSAFEELHRTHVHILVEPMTDLKEQIAKRNMVGNPRISDRTKEDRVELLQCLKRVRRHHASVLQVIFAPPREMLKLKRERPILFRRRIENLDALGNDLWANAITRDYRYLMNVHSKSFII